MIPRNVRLAEAPSHGMPVLYYDKRSRGAVAYQAMAAVLGGTQSLHTNSRDEALSVPTQESAEIALRTQQVLAYETGVAETADPLAGSYYVEELTRKLEEKALQYINWRAV